MNVIIVILLAFVSGSTSDLPVRQTNVFLNYAEITFQRNPTLRKENSAYVISTRHVLALKVNAMGRRIRAMAIRDSGPEMRAILRSLNIRPPRSAPLFIGRVTGQPRSFIFGYQDYVHPQTWPPGRRIPVFCGVIRAYRKLYRIVKFPNDMIIMFEQSDVSAKRFSKNLQTLFQRIGLIFSGWPFRVAQSDHEKNMRQIDRVLSELSTDWKAH